MFSLLLKVLYDIFKLVNKYFEVIVKIKEYMEINNLTHRKFADQIGVSPATIFHFLSGRTKSISFPVIQKIVKGTKGRISMEEVLQEISQAQQ